MLSYLSEVLRLHYVFKQQRRYLSSENAFVSAAVIFYYRAFESIVDDGKWLLRNPKI